MPVVMESVLVTKIFSNNIVNNMGEFFMKEIHVSLQVKLWLDLASYLYFSKIFDTSNNEKNNTGIKVNQLKKWWNGEQKVKWEEGTASLFCTLSLVLSFLETEQRGKHNKAVEHLSTE